MGSSIEVTDSLNALQSKQQQLVLDTVDQLRKCGLESILSLPQLVVCGDQSAGKSSVLEALTEIPFPRRDNLCTRFATEIILRRSLAEIATVKIAPDKDRNAVEQAAIKKFGASLSNFEELPDLIDKATAVMGIGDGASTFSNDLLSIEIAGPNRPQLTVVDLPGLIRNGEPNDIKLVHDLTERYISSPRTICLAVVSATHDHANQGILNMIREHDKHGGRTLGIITKPDRLENDSGSEKSYMALARNEEVVLKLGWHVLKNRSFSEGDTTFLERNANEAAFFKSSNWKTLPKEYTGIDALRNRLSLMLFNHVQGELPKLRDDLESVLDSDRLTFASFGDSRSDAEACKSFLLNRSNEFSNICQAAVGGHYDAAYFTVNDNADFKPLQLPFLRRLRAAVQELNAVYSDQMLRAGRKFKIPQNADAEIALEDMDSDDKVSESKDSQHDNLESMTHSQALDWVKQAMKRGRGKELAGNFNPLLIGELFKVQSSPWERLACEHITQLEDVCSFFLYDLLNHCCPEDVHTRYWPTIEEVLRARKTAALDELKKLTEELHMDPINYNHYYVDTVRKRRCERLAKPSGSLAQSIQNWSRNGYRETEIVKLAVEANMKSFQRDMERFSCEEILDGVNAIYKIQVKTFIANVTTQVIERHMIRGLEDIFSPVVVSRMSKEEIERVASEPLNVKRSREFLKERIETLENGHSILRRVMQNMPA